MRIACAVTMAALALAACEDGAPEQNTILVRAANPTSDNMKTLDPIYRHLALRRGITYNRGKCKRVDRGAYRQDYKTMAMWRARRIASGDLAGFIAAHSSVQAVHGAEVKAARRAECKAWALEPPYPVPAK